MAFKRYFSKDFSLNICREFSYLTGYFLIFFCKNIFYSDISSVIFSSINFSFLQDYLQKFLMFFRDFCVLISSEARLRIPPEVYLEGHPWIASENPQRIPQKFVRGFFKKFTRTFVYNLCWFSADVPSEIPLLPEYLSKNFSKFFRIVSRALFYLFIFVNFTSCQFFTIPRVFLETSHDFLMELNR